MTDAIADTPELAVELAGRITAGLLRATKAFAPSVELADGKRAHQEVTLLDGVLYVGTDRAACTAAVRLRLSEFAKKKSPLRQALAAVEGAVCASVCYGPASLWLRTHGKTVREGRAGPGGILLAVAPGLVELDLAPTPGGLAYAAAVAAAIRDRVGALLAGPFPMPALDGDTAVLRVMADGAEAGPFLLVGTGALAQLRLKVAMLPKGGPAAVSVHEGPHGDRVVRVRTEGAEFEADQYFRVLAL